MPIDWGKMERHVRYGKIAEWVRIIAIIAMADEVFEAIKYHFPLWDDIAIPVTFLIHQMARFIQKYTDLYRIDL